MMLINDAIRPVGLSVIARLLILAQLCTVFVML